MNSTVTLYVNQITPDKNCVVDSLSTYLNDRKKKTINNFQWQKIELRKTIKIEEDQANFPKFEYNYVSIKNEDSDKTYYYFIVGQPKWLSIKAMQLELYLDTINTFQVEIKTSWTDKTKITREHRDRFYKPTTIPDGDITLNRKIDITPEGLETTKKLISKTNITTGYNSPQYLVYKTNIGLTSSYDESNQAIECYVVGEKGETKYASFTYNGITTKDFYSTWTYFVDGTINPLYYTSLTGTLYWIGATTHPGASTVIEANRYLGLSINRVSSDIKVYGLKENGEVNLLDTITSSTSLSNFQCLHNTYCNIFLINYLDNIETYTYQMWKYILLPTYGVSVRYNGTSEMAVSTIEDIDRSDSSIVKIIKMPYTLLDTFTKSYENFYIKTQIPSGQLLTKPIFRLKSLDYAIERDLISLVISKDLQVSLTSDQRNYLTENMMDMESKLKSSEFYEWKFYYDSFEKRIDFEDTVLDPDNTNVPRVTISLKQSNNLNSTECFKFSAQGNLTYNPPILYGEYMNINRSNEIALFNSPYVEYIRNGYNYDKKILAMQQSKEAVNTVVSLGAGTLGGISGIKTGGLGFAAGISFASGAVQSLVNTITSMQISDLQLQQKLDQSANSAASVSNTSDFDIFEWYNGGNLISTKFKCSDEYENSVYELLKLTGYKCYLQEKPDVTSRLWYNYIQCELDINPLSFDYSQDILDDIKTRYDTGVTYYHKVNGIYNFNQNLENFETWLVSGS